MKFQQSVDIKGRFAAIPSPQASVDGLLNVVQALKINVEQLIAARGGTDTASVLQGSFTGPNAGGGPGTAFGALPPNAVDDAAASRLGVPVMGVYRSGSVLKVRVT